MYYTVFGLLGAGLAGILVVALRAATGWPFYPVWLIALAVTTFAVYGLDKALSKTAGRVRAPEMVLHLLALAGGFAGGWLGMRVFHHKSNRQRHPWFVPVLAASTLLHAALGLWLLLG